MKKQNKSFLDWGEDRANKDEFGATVGAKRGEFGVTNCNFGAHGKALHCKAGHLVCPPFPLMLIQQTGTFK